MLGGLLGQIVLVRVYRQLKTVRDVQFGKDGGEMMTNGGLTNIQAFSDMLVPESFTDKGDNLALAFCESGNFGGLGRDLGGWLWPCQITEHSGNHGGFKPDLTSPHLRDRLQEG